MIQDISRREESNSSDSGGNQKNNRIYKNVNHIILILFHFLILK